MESIESLLGGSLSGASADGAPADLLLARESHGLLAGVDHGTAAERQADEVNSERDQIGDVLGGDSSGGCEETSAESHNASVLRRGELIGVLREVANEVAKLGDGGESRLEHGNLLASLVIEVKQVVDGHEVGDPLPLVRSQLLDLITKSSRGALQESGETGIASTEDRLAEQRVLLSSLVTKKENVRHYDACMVCWIELIGVDDWIDLFVWRGIEEYVNPISGRLWWLVTEVVELLDMQTQTEGVELLDMQMQSEGVEVHCG